MDDLSIDEVSSADEDSLSDGDEIIALVDETEHSRLKEEQKEETTSTNTTDMNDRVQSHYLHMWNFIKPNYVKMVDGVVKWHKAQG